MQCCNNAVRHPKGVVRALLHIVVNGRGREIRTPDPLFPKQMRYQAALCPDTRLYLVRYYRIEKPFFRLIFTRRCSVGSKCRML